MTTTLDRIRAGQRDHRIAAADIVAREHEAATVAVAQGCAQGRWRDLAAARRRKDAIAMMPMRAPNTFLPYWSAAELRAWLVDLGWRAKRPNDNSAPTRKQTLAEIHRRGLTMTLGKRRTRGVVALAAMLLLAGCAGHCESQDEPGSRWCIGGT